MRVCNYTLIRTTTPYKDYDIRRATESELQILNGRIKSGIRAEELVSIIAGGEENSISGTGSGSKGDYSGGREIPGRTSRTSNLQEIDDPNSSPRNSVTAKEDQVYLDAVRRGDMETRLHARACVRVCFSILRYCGLYGLEISFKSIFTWSGFS